MIDVQTRREAERFRLALNTLGLFPSITRYTNGGYRIDCDLGSRDEMALEAYLHDGHRADRVTWEKVDAYRQN